MRKAAQESQLHNACRATSVYRLDLSWFQLCSDYRPVFLCYLCENGTEKVPVLALRVIEKMGAQSTFVDSH